MNKVFRKFFMRILVLGVTGMLGNSIIRAFENTRYTVFGTLRNIDDLEYFSTSISKNLITDVDITNQDKLIEIFGIVKPKIVINCIGIVKQLKTASDPLTILPINSMLPHRLSHVCQLTNARLIHISTDCVFSGKKGSYCENDLCDAEDLYGKSKLIGELSQYSHEVTLRTSIIGHGLQSSHALVSWFLAQTQTVQGYTKAFFSGLPTIVLAEIIRDFVIPNKNISGLYHVASKSISKYELLHLIAKIYNKTISIQPNDTVSIDRSLNADKFNHVTGYAPPTWEVLIQKMHNEYLSLKDKKVFNGVL